MNKNELIKTILDEASIHHNIRINFSKMPDEEEGVSYEEYDEIIQHITQVKLDQFVEEWDEKEINDKGNRNLCDCQDKKNGICSKCDSWHVYQYGRMGATLYWDKYWKGENYGFCFLYDEDDLKEIKIEELREILDEIRQFNKEVEVMMNDFYELVKKEIKNVKQKMKAEEKEEKEYQKIKEKILEHCFQKRIIRDLLNL